MGKDLLMKIHHYPTDAEKKYNISSASVDGYTYVWVGKDLLMKIHHCPTDAEKKYNISSASVDG